MVRYIKVKPDSPYYPMSHKGSIAEHRLIMAHQLERPLTSNEIVHHKDGNRHNNGIDNLLLMDCSSHISHHAKLRSLHSRRFKTRNALYKIGIGDSQIDEILSGIASE